MSSVQEEAEVLLSQPFYLRHVLNIVSGPRSCLGRTPGFYRETARTDGGRTMENRRSSAITDDSEPDVVSLDEEDYQDAIFQSYQLDQVTASKTAGIPFRKYEEDRFVVPAPEAAVCKICYWISSKSVLAKCNDDKVLCQECWLESVLNNKPCYFCRSHPSYEKYTSNPVNLSLLSYQFKCKNYSKGCKKVEVLSNYDALLQHEENCTLVQRSSNQRLEEIEANVSFLVKSSRKVEDAVLKNKESLTKLESVQKMCLKTTQELLVRSGAQERSMALLRQKVDEDLRSLEACVVRLKNNTSATSPIAIAQQTLGEQSHAQSSKESRTSSRLFSEKEIAVMITKIKEYRQQHTNLANKDGRTFVWTSVRSDAMELKEKKIKKTEMARFVKRELEKFGFPRKSNEQIYRKVLKLNEGVVSELQ